MALESIIGADLFMSDINGMCSFINKEVSSQEEEEVQQEPYWGLPDSPEMDYFVDQENSEEAVVTYDQFVSPEVCIPDEQGRKIISIVMRRVKDNNINFRGIEHSTFFADHSFYEVSFLNI